MSSAVFRAHALRCGEKHFGSAPCNTWLRPTDARLASFSAVTESVITLRVTISVRMYRKQVQFGF